MATKLWFCRLSLLPLLSSQQFVCGESFYMLSFANRIIYRRQVWTANSYYESSLVLIRPFERMPKLNSWLTQSPRELARLWPTPWQSQPTMSWDSMSSVLVKALNLFFSPLSFGFFVGWLHFITGQGVKRYMPFFFFKCLHYYRNCYCFCHDPLKPSPLWKLIDLLLNVSTINSFFKGSV